MGQPALPVDDKYGLCRPTTNATRSITRHRLSLSFHFNRPDLNLGGSTRSSPVIPHLNRYSTLPCSTPSWTRHYLILPPLTPCGPPASSPLKIFPPSPPQTMPFSHMSSFSHHSIHIKKSNFCDGSVDSYSPPLSLLLRKRA